MVEGGRSGAVLFVGDVVEPGDHLAPVVGFLDGDVRHEPVGGGAMPVLLVRLDVDDVAGADLLNGAAATGDVPDPVGDVDRLALGGGLARSPGARGEADVGAADGGLVVRVADAAIAAGPVGFGGGDRCAGGS